MQNAVVTVNNNICNIVTNKYTVSVLLEKYDEIECIGQGANGVVFLGKNIILNRLEAIKVYIPNKKNFVEEKQFIKEVRKPAALNDKRYVTVYDAYVDEMSGACVCTMEYIDGQTLNKWLDDNHNYLERLKICLDIIRAVEGYQKKGFLHGDIHTNNILVDKNDEIHIIDFGTSIFGGKNYTKQRESYFLYNLVLQVMGNRIIKNSFMFKNYGLYPKRIFNNDDVRNFHPYLVMLTVKAYLEFLDYIEQISVSNVAARDIAELCIIVSKGIYFNIPVMIKEVTGIAEKCDMSENDVAQIIFDNWEVNIFPETMTSLTQAQEIQSDILNVYFNMSYQHFREWDWNRIKDYYFKHYIRYDQDIFDTYADLFRQSVVDNYDEFRDINCCNVEKDIFDNECKNILYCALVASLQNEFGLSFRIWQEINIIWTKKIFESNK